MIAGRPWIAGCAEVILAFGTAVGFALWARDLEMAPLDRWAQVSALAAMGFRVTMIAIVLVAALVIAARVRSGVAFDLTSRLVCAVVAGLVSGMVAGGLVFALQGTPWGLNGSEGDAGTLINWTLGVREGKPPPGSYPPLPFHLIDRYARLRELEVFTAVKHMEILGTAALGPIAYLGWRLLLRPGWALGIGLIAALPLIDVAPYKPYTSIVLISIVPLLIRLLQLIRHADRYSHAQVARRGVLLGLALGGLCLLYSGWFKWSTPGFLFAVLVVFPWRSRVAAGKAALFGAVALAMFGLLAGGHAIDALLENYRDDYHYFDVMVEPGYIAMYRNDLPGAVGSWPPLGELGGVGLFTIVLCVGFAASIVLGAGRTVVIGVGSMMVGCWLMRFYYARDLYESGLVQLYPRTTAEIQYCLLISCGYAVYLAVERAARKAPPESPLRSPSGLIGSVCGLLLLLGMAASSICDHYMPTDSTPHGPGWLAWNAHKQRDQRLVPVVRTDPSQPPTANLTLHAGGWNVTRKGIESSNTCRSSCITPAMAAITGRRMGDLVLELTLQITDPGESDQNWAGVTIHKTNQADPLGLSGHLVYYRANGILEVNDPHQGVLATVDTKLRPTTPRRLRVEAAGERVRVLVDGVLFVDVDPRAGPGAAGYVDFVSYGVTATYEDLTLPR